MREMNILEFHAKNVSDTERLGRALAESLPDGAVIALIGTLGAGKTRLVQAAAEASGVEAGVVVSPTFVLIQEYRDGIRPVYHFDTYRLRDEDEFLELGPEEYFDGEGLTFIEWADKVEDCLPRRRLEVRILIEGAGARRFELVPYGDEFVEAVRLIAESLQ